MTIWSFTEYRPYLFHHLGAEGTRTGQKKRLAEFIPVHTTFVTQVMSGRADFSLEQAERINEFLGHSVEEGEYFLLLLLYARAGSAVLKRRFKSKIEKIRSGRLSVKSRIGATSAISAQDRERFYSSYLYGAIHVLVSISRFRSTDRLAAALRLRESVVKDLVAFLVQIGVLDLVQGELRPGQAHVHLGADSSLIARHHGNWRLHSVGAMQFPSVKDLHYSGCLSLSQEDAFRIKDQLVEQIKRHLQTVAASPEETAYVFNVDFYSLLGEE
jgi:uncharacterized protein (TIGR02147 family)